MPGERILVVEDDADINNIIAAHLGKHGFACTQAWSDSEAALRLESGAFDLVITDLMLPGLTGESIVETVRAQSPTTPIIVVSARTAPRDKVDLLKRGADDYLAKPFDLDELAMRVEVQLRHRARLAAAEAEAGAGHAASTPAHATPVGATAAAPAASDVLAFGRWRIDRTARTFRVDDAPIALTRIEFNIVELLAAHPRKVFTKRELFELAWGEPYSVEDNTVNVHVSNIRGKLRASGTDSYIVTVWGMGFKLADAPDA